MTEELQVSAGSSKRPTWDVIMLAIITPISVLIAVIDHWPQCGWLQRIGAVILLALLVEIPFLAFSRNPRVQNLFQGPRALIPGYGALILAAIVLGPRLKL